MVEVQGVVSRTHEHMSSRVMEVTIEVPREACRLFAPGVRLVASLPAPAGETTGGESGGAK